MDKATLWVHMTKILVGKIMSYLTTWYIAWYVRVSSLACKACCVLLVAIIIVYLRLSVASTNVIIGAMMDRGVTQR
jgi:hypothetical protein